MTAHSCSAWKPVMLRDVATLRCVCRLMEGGVFTKNRSLYLGEEPKLKRCLQTFPIDTIGTKMYYTVGH